MESALLPDLRGSHGRYQCNSSGLRQTLDFPRGRWLLAWALALLFALAVPEPSRAQDGEPRIDPLEAPPRLTAGRSARVEAHVERAEACQLRFKREVMSTVDPGSAATITWTWRVPDVARDESWDGDVACWSRASDVGREGADKEDPFEVVVDGTPDGVLEIIEPDTLTVELSPDDETDARPSLERWADMAQLGTVLATVLAVLFAWYQVSVTRRHTRSERTGKAFDQLRKEEFIANWSKVFAFLRVKDEAECVDRIRREVRVPSGNDPLFPRDGDGALVLNDIHAVHDTYEETGLRFNDGTLEQQTVIRAFGDSIANLYLNSWWWVHYQRGCRDRAIAARWVRKREAVAYAEWERMVREMVDRSPASRDELAAGWDDSAVRAICLPPQDGATLTEWRLAGRLSAAVGAVLRGPARACDFEDFLSRQLPGLRLPEPFIPVTRTVLLPPWPDLLTFPSRPRRAAVAAGAWLDQRREKHGGSPAGYRLVRLDPWVVTCQRYQEMAWRLDACREKLGDDDLIRRLDTVFTDLA